ncbi:Protein kinase domain-containing protein [Aphelenchoides besseyi]|nr:Protein kinase domain-containing protein [Aphelenchoides besseyi]
MGSDDSSDSKNKKKDNDKDDGTKMKPGMIVTSPKHAYVIVKLLGEGGFGAVYKVHDQADKNKEYALKVEKKISKRKHSKLKMEVAILKLVGQERSAEVSHFTACIDRGKKEKYFFLVMELVGQSLDDLKRERPQRVFSMGTGIGVSIQCLEAVEDLHKHGFLHRDIKPANYACGLNYKRHIASCLIYLLDFGIARKYLNENNQLKTPRKEVGFKGTVRFASINCHKNVELGPKDDVESWFYLVLDMIVTSGLPWKKYGEKAEVLKCKEDSRTSKRKELFHGLKCADTFGIILDYIDRQTYSDHIDYRHIYQCMKIAAADCGVNSDAAYDWELETNTARPRGRSSSSQTK